MAMIQTFYPIREMPTPTQRTTFRMSITLRRGMKRSLEHERAPVAAPAMLID